MIFNVNVVFLLFGFVIIGASIFNELKLSSNYNLFITYIYMCVCVSINFI